MVGYGAGFAGSTVTICHSPWFWCLRRQSQLRIVGVIIGIGSRTGCAAHPLEVVWEFSEYPTGPFDQ